MRKAITLTSKRQNNPIYIVIEGSNVRVSKGFVEKFPRRVTFCVGDNPQELILEYHPKHATYCEVDSPEVGSPRIKRSASLAHTLREMGYAEDTRHVVTMRGDEFVLTPAA